MLIKTRGALSNPEGRFDLQQYENYYDGWDLSEEDKVKSIDTLLYPESAKTVITRNDSPDLGFDQSINPYRGCEHGCIYCYARPSHAYMNLSPGLDFETKIFYKANVKHLLLQELAKPKYECNPIMLGSNTDPYQPAEKKLLVTRHILEVLHQYQHPVVIITKSAAIERDIDLLTDMAKKNLVKVAISLTTLNNDLKRTLEPRTGAPQARLRVIRKLTDASIPVRVMAAPMIPMINDKELEHILAAAAEAGAKHASYVLIRLPYEVKDLFKEWLAEHYPDRAEHVMSLIRQMRGGKEYEAKFGERMVGKGEFASLLEQRFFIACKRHKLNLQPSVALNTGIFQKPNLSPQLDLFG